MNRAIGPYHTLEELIGRKVVVSDLIQKLSAIPRSDVLRCLAGFSAQLEREVNSSYQQQIRILREVTRPELAETIQTAIKRERDFGALFHRRQLWFVLQMAVLACKNDSTVSHDDQTLKEVGECCLMANDLLKAIESIQFTTPEEAKQLDYAMAALISYSELSLGSEVIARSQLLWLEIPEEERFRKLWRQYGFQKDLGTLFADKYGVPLKEFLLYVTVLYYKFLESTVKDVPSSVMYDSTKAFHDLFDPEHIKNALSLISSTPDELAVRLLGSPRQTWAIDSTALIKTPLLKLGETHYVCPDLHMFRAFLVQGVFELLMEASDASKLKQFLGDLFEAYIERLMRNFAPKSSVLVNSYFNPVEFVSEDAQEAADGLLLWPSLAVLLECKTNMLTTRQRYAMSLPETTKAIDDQLATFQKFGDRKPGDRNKRKGIGQLAYNLARILSGEQVRCNGQILDFSGIKKFYPAVVIYDEGMANHAVRLHLQFKLVEWFQGNGIDHSRVGHTLLFTIRDMEYFELLAHKIGAEKLMKDYVNYVEQNPRNLYSMFHEFALNKYTQDNESTGYIHDTVKRLLTAIKTEIEGRKRTL